VPLTPYEKLNITNVYTNATQNTVFVDVISTTQKANINSNITQAIFKDTNGTIVEIENLSTLVLQGQSTTLRINCTLASGNYTVTLITPNGSTFVSPIFTIH
jgi:hypothetical protein